MEKITLIKKILKERLRSVPKMLKEAQSNFDELKNAKFLIKNEELMSGLSHQIGYLTALTHELKLTIELLGMDVNEIEELIAKNQKIEAENKAYMKKIFKEISNGRDGKNKRTI